MAVLHSLLPIPIFFHRSEPPFSISRFNYCNFHGFEERYKGGVLRVVASSLFLFPELKGEIINSPCCNEDDDDDNIENLYDFV